MDSIAITDNTRRDFLKKSGLLMLSGGILSSSSLIDYRKVFDREKHKKLGVALVGLGRYATWELAPAFEHTSNCKIAGVVTGSPAKAKLWQKMYDLPDKNIYSYENFDTIADNEDIDVVYVVLPNSMHAEYTIRAANAGKHVISEKPMAISSDQCKSMIQACQKNKVKLSIGYRLHFDPYHLKVMELGQNEKFGRVKSIEANDSELITNPDEWRIHKELSGGGPIMDLGIYTIQGACYTLGEAPIEIMEARYGQKKKPDLFKSVEESMTWKMKFPGGVESQHSSSYVINQNILAGEAENGWWKIEQSYAYSGQKGTTMNGPINLPQVNQQALQMDDFAYCILNNKEPLVPGEMGLRDLLIIEAVKEAAISGKEVTLNIDTNKIPTYKDHIAKRA